MHTLYYNLYTSTYIYIEHYYEFSPQHIYGTGRYIFHVKYNFSFVCIIFICCDKYVFGVHEYFFCIDVSIIHVPTPGFSNRWDNILKWLWKSLYIANNQVMFSCAICIFLYRVRVIWDFEKLGENKSWS